MYTMHPRTALRVARAVNALRHEANELIALAQLVEVEGAFHDELERDLEAIERRLGIEEE